MNMFKNSVLKTSVDTKRWLKAAGIINSGNGTLFH